MIESMELLQSRIIIIQNVYYMLNIKKSRFSKKILWCDK